MAANQNKLITTLSDLRGLAHQAKDPNVNLGEVSSLRSQIMDLESRIKTLEFIISTPTYAGQYGQGIRPKPPVYTAQKPDLPTRPLF